LVTKEVQLHRDCILIAVVLAVLHLASIALLKLQFYERDSDAGKLLEVFWILWFILPAVVGARAVSEERRFDTWTTALCLPVSGRRQLAVKYGTVLVLALFYGSLCPSLLEGFRYAIEAGDPWKPLTEILEILSIISLTVAFLSSYASTLSKNLLQALGFTVLVGAACVVAGYVFEGAPTGYLTQDRTYGLLGQIIGWPVLGAALLWMGYKNCRHPEVGPRLLRTNLYGYGGVLLSTTLLTSAIYHRAWELLGSLESEHGEARISASADTQLAAPWSGMRCVAKLDGRLWISGGRLIDRAEGNPGTSRQLPGTFLSSSNWTDLATGLREVVGIQSDGSLWTIVLASPPAWTNSSDRVQIGTERNWKKVERGKAYFLALKTNGTLWKFPEDPNPRSSAKARAQTQIGTASDWAKIHASDGYYAATKTDGSVWAWGEKPEVQQNTVRNGFQEEPVRWSGDHADLDMSRQGWLWSSMSLGADGSLWIYSFEFGRTVSEGTNRLTRIGEDSDWKAFTVVNGGATAIALKRDGSLWKIPLRQSGSWLHAPQTVDPVRLGTQTDWVAVTGTWDNLFALAADGSIWRWDGRAPGNPGFLLAPSRKPTRVAGIYD
jgi:hypothetical protein